MQGIYVTKELRIKADNKWRLPILTFEWIANKQSSVPYKAKKSLGTKTFGRPNSYNHRLFTCRIAEATFDYKAI